MANPSMASTPLPDDDNEQVPDGERTPREGDGTAEVPAGGAGADSGAVDAVEVDPDDEASIPNRSPMNDEPGVGTRRPDERGGDSA